MLFFFLRRRGPGVGPALKYGFEGIGSPRYHDPAAAAPIGWIGLGLLAAALSAEFTGAVVGTPSSHLWWSGVAGLPLLIAGVAALVVARGRGRENVASLDADVRRRNRPSLTETPQGAALIGWTVMMAIAVLATGGGAAILAMGGLDIGNDPRMTAFVIIVLLVFLLMGPMMIVLATGRLAYGTFGVYLYNPVYNADDDPGDATLRASRPPTRPSPTAPAAHVITTTVPTAPVAPGGPSAQPLGPGWWQATDGLYYPPHLHPNYARLQAEVGNV